MRIKKSKAFVSLLLAAALSVGSCLSASAVAYSDWSEASGYKYSYRFRAILDISEGKAKASTRIETKNGSFAPSGYMGADAFLFRSNGSLVDSTGMTYPNSSCAGLTIRVSSSERGTFYSRGLVSICTGYTNGEPDYMTLHTDQTTYGTYSLSPSVGYRTNSDGETYGSGLLADVYGEYPDLVQAEGVNGIKGYVRYDDLVYIPSSLEDAVAYSSSTEDKSIPVYNIDGEVVDTFVLSNSSTDVDTPVDIITD